MSVGATDPPYRCAFERQEVDRLAGETAAKLEELRIAVEALAACESATIPQANRLVFERQRISAGEIISGMSGHLKSLMMRVKVMREL